MAHYHFGYLFNPKREPNEDDIIDLIDRENYDIIGVNASVTDNGDGTYTITCTDVSSQPYAYLTISNTGTSPDLLRNIVGLEGLTVTTRFMINTDTTADTITAPDINYTIGAYSDINVWEENTQNVTSNNEVNIESKLRFQPAQVMGATIIVDMTGTFINGIKNVCHIPQPEREFLDNHTFNCGLDGWGFDPNYPAILTDNGDGSVHLKADSDFGSLVPNDQVFEDADWVIEVAFTNQIGNGKISLKRPDGTWVSTPTLGDGVHKSVPYSGAISEIHVGADGDETYEADYKYISLTQKEQIEEDYPPEFNLIYAGIWNNKYTIQNNAEQPFGTAFYGQLFEADTTTPYFPTSSQHINGIKLDLYSDRVMNTYFTPPTVNNVSVYGIYDVIDTTAYKIYAIENLGDGTCNLYLGSYGTPIALYQSGLVYNEPIDYWLTKEGLPEYIEDLPLPDTLIYINLGNNYDSPNIELNNIPTASGAAISPLIDSNGANIDGSTLVFPAVDNVSAGNTAHANCMEEGFTINSLLKTTGASATINITLPVGNYDITVLTSRHITGVRDTKFTIGTESITINSCNDNIGSHCGTFNSISSDGSTPIDLIFEGLTTNQAGYINGIEIKEVL